MSLAYLLNLTSEQKLLFISGARKAIEALAVKSMLVNLVVEEIILEGIRANLI